MKRAVPGARYRIGEVARLTGISPHALRMWERRYGALSELRTPKGARLYVDDDVARLRLLKKLLDAGHAVSSIYPLGAAELARIAADYHPPPVDPAPETGPLSDTARARFLDAIERLDVEAAAQALARAAVAFSTKELLTEVVAPILEEVGQRWEDGRFSVAHEHAATAVVRSLLGGMLPAAGSGDLRRPVAVAGTLEGELHELGALFAALIASFHGYRVLYLGPSLPARELAKIAADTRARIVLLSMVNQASGDVIERLHRSLPEGTELFVGGRAASRIRRELGPGIHLVSDLPSLDASLEKAMSTR